MSEYTKRMLQLAEDFKECQKVKQPPFTST